MSEKPKIETRIELVGSEIYFTLRVGKDAYGESSTWINRATVADVETLIAELTTARAQMSAIAHAVSPANLKVGR